MIKPMWDAKAVKTYETGQGVELVNKPHPHYEPVATKNNDGVTLHLGWDDLPVGTKLYATPPQRTWVGLTEEELKPICAEWRIVYGAWMDDFAKDIEAKLKEKNS
jgi:hypothetical protein